uniref:Uncharacterized protein n=1 Tax=Oryza sativa subsp. japonica TaxID=39947 RepID=Q75H64_ORYSJ|nr:hypothetical protein [Oryza sativa Japonica Group]
MAAPFPDLMRYARSCSQRGAGADPGLCGGRLVGVSPAMLCPPSTTTTTSSPSIKGRRVSLLLLTSFPPNRRKSIAEIQRAGRALSRRARGGSGSGSRTSTTSLAADKGGEYTAGGGRRRPDPRHGQPDLIPSSSSPLAAAAAI